MSVVRPLASLARQSLFRPLGGRGTGPALVHSQLRTGVRPFSLWPVRPSSVGGPSDGLLRGTASAGPGIPSESLSDSLLQSASVSAGAEGTPLSTDPTPAAAQTDTLLADPTPAAGQTDALLADHPASAGAETGAETGSDLAALLTDPNTPLSPDLFTSLGLKCAYTPVGWVQSLLEFIHLHAVQPLGLDPGSGAWILSTVLTAITIRALTLPLVLGSLKSGAKLRQLAPQIAVLQRQITLAKQSRDIAGVQRAGLALRALFTRHKVNPLSQLKYPLAQMPIFVAAFTAITKLADLPLPQLRTGGIGPVLDLSAPDPSHWLPCAATALTWITVEMGPDGQKSQAIKANPQAAGMMWAFRVGMAFLLYWTWNFSAIALVYLMTSSALTVIQGLVFRTPAFKRWMRLIPTQPVPRPRPRQSL